MLEIDEKERDGAELLSQPLSSYGNITSSPSATCKEENIGGEEQSVDDKEREIRAVDKACVTTEIRP
eukprot:10493023-Ditylum_brightwellii.AAC.1